MGCLLMGQPGQAAYSGVMGARNVRAVAVVVFFVGSIVALFGFATTATFEPPEYRLGGALAGLAGLVPFAWAMWREPYVIAKGSAVTAMIIGAFALLMSQAENGTYLPAIGCLGWLGLSAVLMVRPPGTGKPHEVLDGAGGKAFEVEGVHFVAKVVSSRRDEGLVLDVVAQNCWTAPRTLVVELDAPVRIELGPGEVKRTQLKIDVRKRPPARQNLVFEIAVLGWKGRRALPRRGRIVAHRVTRTETAIMALAGHPTWGGGWSLEVDLL